VVNGTTEALLLENEVANITLDAMGEGLLRTDLHGHIMYLNRMAEELTGWSRQEARAFSRRTCSDLLRMVQALTKRPKSQPKKVKIRTESLLRSGAIEPRGMRPEDARTKQ
jgi:PAS domain S-box-containing protein